MIIARAPVRMSMGGGGTDLASYYRQHGGFLMAAAINRYVYLMLNKRFHKTIRLSYSTTEIVESVDKIAHPIFREALRLTDVRSQVELVSVADVPSNCGLGTSSAFTVALLSALYAHKKEVMSAQELAEAACHLEINILREPIGKQDQYASAFGGFNAYWFNRDGSVFVEPVAIAEADLVELQNNLLLFHVGRERSASVILSSQDRKARAADRNVIARLHAIKALGLRAKRVFERGRIDEFGEILHEHWLAKKRLSARISDAFIDEAYDTARRHGAIGGKIVGAGGGGFLLFYCPARRSRLVAALAKLGLRPTWVRFETEGAKTVFHSS